MSARAQAFKRTETARLARAARDAGLIVKAITRRPDGTVALEVGEPDREALGAVQNPWEQDDADAT